MRQLALVALAYGLMFEDTAFSELLIAWLVALIFTWLVIEPGEVLGLVLFPKLMNGKRAKVRGHLPAPLAELDLRFAE